jgi:hypothetical protein
MAGSSRPFPISSATSGSTAAELTRPMWNWMHQVYNFPSASPISRSQRSKTRCAAFRQARLRHSRAAGRRAAGHSRSVAYAVSSLVEVTSVPAQPASRSACSSSDICNQATPSTSAAMSSRRRPGSHSSSGMERWSRTRPYSASVSSRSLGQPSETADATRSASRKCVGDPPGDERVLVGADVADERPAGARRGSEECGNAAAHRLGDDRVPEQVGERQTRPKLPGVGIDGVAVERVVLAARPLHEANAASHCSKAAGAPSIAPQRRRQGIECPGRS